MEKQTIRILFVDDDVSVIDMLKKMIHSLNNEWYVRYAIGGVEALELLESETFDVVVTDLSMPEINGVKLLKYIYKFHNEIVRIVFSSSLSRESVRAVAPFTQRFIAKPCGLSKLAQTIENSLFIYRELDNKKIQKVLTKTGTIPSLPRVYQELMDKVIAAGNSAGELIWQMPMFDEYNEDIKSNVADMNNVGSRYGGSISGAKFLAEFVGDTPWVHLDIAGTSDTDKEKNYLVKGATGVPVRTLVNLVLDLAR